MIHRLLLCSNFPWRHGDPPGKENYLKQVALCLAECQLALTARLSAASAMWII